MMQLSKRSDGSYRPGSSSRFSLRVADTAGSIRLISPPLRPAAKPTRSPRSAHSSTSTSPLMLQTAQLVSINALIRLPARCVRLLCFGSCVIIGVLALLASPGRS